MQHVNNINKGYSTLADWQQCLISSYHYLAVMI